MAHVLGQSYCISHESIHGTPSLHNKAITLWCDKKKKKFLVKVLNNWAFIG